MIDLKLWLPVADHCCDALRSLMALSDRTECRYRGRFGWKNGRRRQGPKVTLFTHSIFLPANWRFVLRAPV